MRKIIILAVLLTALTMPFATISLAQDGSDTCEAWLIVERNENRNTDIYLVDLAGAENFETFLGGDTILVHWESNDADDGGHLFTVNLSTGETAQITEFEGFAFFDAWQPYQTQFVATLIEPDFLERHL